MYEQILYTLYFLYGNGTHTNKNCIHSIGFYIKHRIQSVYNIHILYHFVHSTGA